MPAQIQYILTRAIVVLLVAVGCVYGNNLYRKNERKKAIDAELKSICSESSYFRQFYEDAAKKSLVKALALLAEAENIGQPVDDTINRALGIQKKLLTTDADREPPPPSKEITHRTLLANYQNFLKLGYQPDYQTLSQMKNGELPRIPTGPEEGKTAEIVPLIPAKLSPGIEKVIANLELRPPGKLERPMTDLEIAAAKQMASDLAGAGFIEATVRDRITAEIATKEESVAK